MTDEIPSPENPVRVWFVLAAKLFANGKRETIERASFGTDYIAARQMFDNYTKPKGCRAKAFVTISSCTNDGSGSLKHILHVDVFTVREL